MISALQVEVRRELSEYELSQLVEEIEEGVVRDMLVGMLRDQAPRLLS